MGGDWEVSTIQVHDGRFSNNLKKGGRKGGKQVSKGLTGNKTLMKTLDGGEEMGHVEKPRQGAPRGNPHR